MKFKPKVKQRSTKQITMETNKYSFWIGLGKTAKNSAWMLIPFGLALLASAPASWAWAAGPAVYFLKNLYENYNK